MAKQKAKRKKIPRKAAREEVVIQAAPVMRRAKSRTSRMFGKAKRMGANMSAKQVSLGDVVGTIAASVIAMGAAKATDSLVPDWAQAAALTVTGAVFFWAGKKRGIGLALWGVAAYEATHWVLVKIDAARKRYMDAQDKKPAAE